MEKASITRVRTFRVFDTSSLVLFLDWCPGSESVTRLAVSSSGGHIAVLNFDPDVESCCHFKAHSLEAWCVAWDNANHEKLYSGGDDSILCVHNSWCLELENEISGTENSDSQNREEHEEYLPYSRDSKAHAAGVTAILPLGKDDNGDAVIITGSYDQYLRVLKCQNGRKNWQTVADLELGGGVWRLKLIKKLPQSGVIEPGKLRILASCMHAGPRIVQLELSPQGTWSTECLAQFAEHESMNYASDINEDLPVNDHCIRTVVSSSFYDKKLCVWHIEDA